ncbi:50S ribosomal protein L30e [Candidatus Woesearchaeota archaeon]|nr:50S ribosomal protein L30e [Candidatus Woesearchaeota archaeon]
MAVKEMDANISELKKLLKSDKIILGTDRTLKLLKLGTTDRVFLSSNCPEEVKKDIEYYAKLSNVPLIYLKQPNDELGILCKKPYPVSVLSVTQ